MKSRYSLLFIIAPLFAPLNSSIGTKPPQHSSDPTQASYLHRLVQKATHLTDTQRRTLTRAILLFHTTIGFAPTLHKALSPEINGHIYEIETAVHLAAQKYTVLIFNTIITSGETKREFDIIAQAPDGTDHWIECKAGKPKDWNKQQFAEQQRIAQIIATRQAKKTIVYRVYSRTRLTSSWREWFDEHNITCEEIS